MNYRNMISGGLTLLLVGITVGVWPTRYRTERISIGVSPSVLVRIDRFTGKAEMLTAAGWQVMQKVKSSAESAVLPADELHNVEGIRGSWCAEGQHFLDSTFCVDLYNGSHWQIQSLAISVMAMDSNGAVERRRRYDVNSLNIAPFSCKRILVSTVDKPKDFQWRIITVKGIPDPNLSSEPKVDFSNKAFQDSRNPKEPSKIDFGKLRTSPDGKGKR